MPRWETLVEPVPSNNMDLSAYGGQDVNSALTIKCLLARLCTGILIGMPFLLKFGCFGPRQICISMTDVDLGPFQILNELQYTNTLWTGTIQKVWSLWIAKHNYVDCHSYTHCNMQCLTPDVLIIHNIHAILCCDLFFAWAFEQQATSCTDLYKTEAYVLLNDIKIVDSNNGDSLSLWNSIVLPNNNCCPWNWSGTVVQKAKHSWKLKPTVGAPRSLSMAPSPNLEQIVIFFWMGVRCSACLLWGLTWVRMHNLGMIGTCDRGSRNFDCPD